MQLAGGSVAENWVPCLDHWGLDTAGCGMASVEIVRSHGLDHPSDRYLCQDLVALSLDRCASNEKSLDGRGLALGLEPYLLEAFPVSC